MASDAVTETLPSGNLRARIMERRAAGYPDQRKQSFTIQGPRPKRPRQLVYFIRHSDGPIKIGMALDPLARLRGMQTAHYAELALIAVCKGGRKKEAAYHARFSEHHIRGEWFAPHPDILAEIERLKEFAE